MIPNYPFCRISSILIETTLPNNNNPQTDFKLPVSFECFNTFPGITFPYAYCSILTCTQQMIRATKYEVRDGTCKISVIPNHYCEISNKLKFKVWVIICNEHIMFK